MLMLTVLPFFDVGSMKAAVFPLLLTDRQSWLPAADHILSHAESIKLKCLDRTLWFTPSMAPHSRSVDLSRIESWTTSATPGEIFKMVVFISIIASAIKSYAVLSLRRKKKLDHLSSVQETEAVSSRPVGDKDVQSCQLEDPNQRLQALKQELLQPTLKSVYPWIAPPTPLPGPYDAPYYPLPSIRRHSQDPSYVSPEETQTISYTRRISTNSLPAQEPIVRATTTVSNHGWRRTQWTVATG